VIHNKRAVVDWKKKKEGWREGPKKTPPHGKAGARNAPPFRSGGKREETEIITLDTERTFIRGGKEKSLCLLLIREHQKKGTKGRGLSAYSLGEFPAHYLVKNSLQFA